MKKAIETIDLIVELIMVLGGIAWVIMRAVPVMVYAMLYDTCAILTNIVFGGVIEESSSVIVAKNVVNKVKGELGV